MNTTNGHCNDHVCPQVKAPQALPPPVTPEDYADVVDALEDAHGLSRQLLGQLPADQQWQ